MLMKNLMRAAILGGAALNLGACATIMNGTSQPVTFRTEPVGAEAVLINGNKCTTPCKYSLKRGKDSQATISLAGYEPVSIYIHSRTGGATFGNILAGGIIGGVVDGSNGASNHLYPNPVYIKLAPLGSGEPALLLDKKGKRISTVDEYNAKVAEDVKKGLEEQGMFPMGKAASK
jgi:hypothetical protein